ncbi:RNA 3'-terminal phosphate cyclase [Methylomonas sp. LL1]|uniref:RNA 3'-terminal phosphate cyclase n=1 Tax=Methylomonas sp. LL1 TaxID=2785785 RepID=UPI0018C40B04|nr:RNA 3'-terminal phosphate cyclase [Methylomonas sp. LL1]QPK63367.1 RNA 3'-terminal phosphate cyclase [Methylomonas sp. LL1]
MSRVNGIIEIDGSHGEGGGQVLRTALSLAACLGKGVHIRHIRAGRKNPGLMRQHLACVKAIAEICDADVKGATIGSKAVEFLPGKIKAGDYRFAVGSAGSSTLVFQTVLPALLLAGKPSRLTLVGGTHNPLAPSYDFILDAFLPVLRLIGCEFECSLIRYGFYPVGAGEWTIGIKPPEQFNKLRLEARGQPRESTARCISAGIPGHVSVREKQQLLRRLKWPDDSIVIQQVESLGPGNSVIIKMRYSNVTEVIESHGAVGISAERVANLAVDSLRRYLDAGAPVGEHLADQLLLPLCLGAGGSFVTGPLSDHCKTNIDIIRQLSDASIAVAKMEHGQQCRIEVKPTMAQ